jgi:ATP-binding protein involved in chromosome partitioning
MEVNANGRLVPAEAYGIKAISFGFISDAFNPAIWRGPMVDKAIQQLCFDVEWDGLEYLVIDLPPGTGDVQLSIIENLQVTAALVVTTPQDIALIDAHKAVSMFEKMRVPVLGLVENMAYHVCRACGHQDHIFGGDGLATFAIERHLPVLARIPLLREIRERSDLGVPVALSESGPAAMAFAALAAAIYGTSDLSKGLTVAEDLGDMH